MGLFACATRNRWHRVGSALFGVSGCQASGLKKEPLLLLLVRVMFTPTARKSAGIADHCVLRPKGSCHDSGTSGHEVALLIQSSM